MEPVDFLTARVNMARLFDQLSHPAKTQEVPMSNSAVILACLAAEQPMTIAYKDAQGILSVRSVQANSIERCQNGNTIVRCFDLHRREPRSFTLERIHYAVPGTDAEITMSLRVRS